MGQWRALPKGSFTMCSVKARVPRRSNLWGSCWLTPRSDIGDGTCWRPEFHASKSPSKIATSLEPCSLSRSYQTSKTPLTRAVGLI